MSYKPPSNFEWRTDVTDGGWEKPVVPSSETAVSKRWYPRLIALLMLIGVIVVSIVVLYRQTDDHVTTVNQEIIEDVLATHQLWQQAVVQRDSEILETLLPTSDVHWRDVQQDLLQTGLLTHLAPLGLWLAETAVVTPTITVAPNLNQAVVTADLPYLNLKAEHTQTVTLSQQWHYQREQGRWRHVPLPTSQAFWGAWQTERGQWVTVVYPARDRGIATRFTVDLDALIGQLCRAAISCPHDFQLQLRLAYNQAALLQLHENPYNLFLGQGLNSTTYHMSLPTPTLVGVPTDVVSYDAWYRGYASWVAATLLHQLSDEYPRAPAQTLSIWQLHLPYPADYNPFVEVAPPIPLPEQIVHMLCQEATQPTWWRYMPSSDQWKKEQNIEQLFTSFNTTSLPRLLPAPHDDGVLLLAPNDLLPQSQWQLWHHTDEANNLWQTADSAFTFPSWLAPRLHPNGRFLPLRFIISDSASNRLGTLYTLLDSENCTQSGCTTLSNDALTYWSPDERHTLIAHLGDRNLQISLGDSEGTAITSLAVGWSPFWLDEQQFGYVQAGGEGVMVGSNIVTRTVADETPSQTLLTVDDLTAVIPPLERRNTLIIDTVFNLPSRANQLLIAAFTVEQGQIDTSYLYRYDVERETLTLITKDRRLGEPLALSTNGRFLVRIHYAASDWRLTVHDLTQQQSRSYPLTGVIPTQLETRYDWSADGEWLVIVENGRLRLVAPAYDFYEKSILHTFTACNSVAWSHQ